MYTSYLNGIIVIINKHNYLKILYDQRQGRSLVRIGYLWKFFWETDSLAILGGNQYDFMQSINLDN